MTDNGEIEWLAATDPVDGTRWRIDVGFTDSNWTCLWGRGCLGILDEPAADRNEGCCSVGAQLLDDDEARRVGAFGATLDPDRFQYAETAAADGVFADESRAATRVVDGACIFLNRPGFAGGAGCALHLGAVDDDEPPMDWKPAVCWQLPLKVTIDDDGVRTLRRWQRVDWGEGGTSMAWCCTDHPPAPATGGASSPTGPDDRPSAYVGEQPVAISLRDELSGLLGPELAAALRDRTVHAPSTASSQADQ